MQKAGDHRVHISAGCPTLRIAVGIHLVAICICAAFARLDGLGHLPSEYSAAGLTLGVALWASLLAWPGCPVVVLVTAFRRGLSWAFANAIVAEGLLCVGQYIVLLPTFQ